jgi:hypothetical protein
MSYYIIRIFGGNLQTGDVEFQGEFTSEVGEESYFQTRREYGVEERVELQFEVDLQPDRTIRTAATISGFRSIEAEMPSSHSVYAFAEHARSADKDCRLVRLETGNSSKGMCLECPDG